MLSDLLWTSCWCVVGGWCRGWLGHPCCVLRRITDYRRTITGSPPLLSDLDIVCEMEHEGPLEWVFKASHFFRLALYFFNQQQTCFFFACFSTLPNGNCKKNIWFGAQNSVKNNFLLLCLETSLAWNFSVSVPLSKITHEHSKKNRFSTSYEHNELLKQKIRGRRVKSWPNVLTKQLQSCKKVQQKYRDIACKAIFSLPIWDRPLKFMLQHPTVCFDWKQSKYSSKELLVYDFLHKSRLMSERLWQTALADHCMNKPLKTLRWSYWRLIWRQNCFDMYHWPLGRSEKFHFEHFEI